MLLGQTASLVANVTKLTEANQQPPDDRGVCSPLRNDQLQFQRVALFLMFYCSYCVFVLVLLQL